MGRRTKRKGNAFPGKGAWVLSGEHCPGPRLSYTQYKPKTGGLKSGDLFYMFCINGACQTEASLCTKMFSMSVMVQTLFIQTCSN